MSMLSTCCRRIPALGPTRPSFLPSGLPASCRITPLRATWPVQTATPTRPLTLPAAPSKSLLHQLPASTSTGLLEPSRWTLQQFLPSLRRSVRDYYRPPPPRSNPRASGTGSNPGGGAGGGGASGWWHRMKQTLDRTNPQYVMYAIIGLNVLVWGAWKAAQQNLERFRDPALFKFLLENFATSWQNFQQGRFWTLLTASFSQISELHLLVNCFVIFTSAAQLMQLLGVSRYLGIYLVGGIVSSAVSVWWRGDRPGFSVGASGAVYATLALYGCMFPSAQFYLFALLPLPAWACIGGIFLWDAYFMLTDNRAKQGGSDNAGHVGGLLAGAGIWWFRLRHLFRRF